MNGLMAFLISQSDLLLLLIRIILGIVMIYYGLPKIKDLKSNASDFKKMGVKPGLLFGTIVAFVEFFGGILLIVGLFTGYVAIAFGFEMIMGVLYKVTKTTKPFTDWSYDLILFAAMVLLLIIGPGAHSLSSIY